MEYSEVNRRSVNNMPVFLAYLFLTLAIIRVWDVVENNYFLINRTFKKKKKKNFLCWNIFLFRVSDLANT